MKKIWKKLCACALTVACGINLSACGKDDEVNKDLDGDGNVSVWETMFGTESSFRVDSDATSTLIQGDIVNISSADELIAIGSEENVAKKISGENAASRV